jgi:hypothetical protein
MPAALGGTTASILAHFLGMPNQSGGVIFSATTNAVGLVEEVISITEWSFGVLVNRDGNCLDMLVAPALPHRMGKLGLWSVPKPRNVGNIFRFIRLQAALATPARIGVITYKGLLEKIADLLPANVVARHFGALAGMNDMQDVAGLIVIGRPAPKWSDVEATASVFAGRPISSGEGHFFDRHPGGILLADDTVIATPVDRHPEPIGGGSLWGNYFRRLVDCAPTGPPSRVGWMFCVTCHCRSRFMGLRGGET